MKTKFLPLIVILLIALAGCATMETEATVEAEVVIETEAPAATATTAPTAIPEATETAAEPPAAEAENIDQEMLDFPVNLIDGSTLTLRDLQGQRVMLVFFSVYCGHCHNESQHLEAIYQDYKDQGFVIVSAEVSGAPTEEVVTFAEDYGITYPIGSDPQDNFALYMGVTGVPHNFFIDENGSVVDEMRGFSTEDALREKVALLLGE